MYRSPKGMNDLLPAGAPAWSAMERKLRRIFAAYGYAEIRTPILEETELFSRSIGAASEIVEKEMFTFRDKGGESLTLRPEGTAPIVRSYLEHHLGHGEPLLKVWYLGPMFRHERPQKGRFRQFHQVGAEAIGSAHPIADAEVILLVMSVLRAFEVPGARLELSSVGDAGCRPDYRSKLRSYLEARCENLCENCRRRIEANPMRVFDCKSGPCAAQLKDAPRITDHLCRACREHFSSVQEALREAGVSFEVNPRIVRGLDYYTRTAFEVSAHGLGAQNAVAGGGRYDGLAEELGGPAVPGVGFALGLERLLLAARNPGREPAPVRIEILPLEAAAQGEAFRQVTKLREALAASGKDAVADLSPEVTSLKSALRRADKNGARHVVLLGGRELRQKSALVKDLAAHTQEEVPFPALVDTLLGKIR